MSPLPPIDRLRLAEQRQRELGESWPRSLTVRQAVADWLMRVATRLDPPSRRTAPVVGRAARR
jgi:hypothetical protein